MEHREYGQPRSRDGRYREEWSDRGYQGQYGGPSDWNRDRQYGGTDEWNVERSRQGQSGYRESGQSREWDTPERSRYPQAGQEQWQGPSNYEEGRQFGGQRWSSGSYRGGQEQRGGSDSFSMEEHGVYRGRMQAQEQGQSGMRGGPSQRGNFGMQTGPHSGKGPRNYRRSDERIREDVSDQLTDHSQLDASNIEVMVSSGEITLKGTVESRSMKRLAEDLAESVSGVKEVNNQLRVQQRESASSGFDEDFEKTGRSSQKGSKTATAP